MNKALTSILILVSFNVYSNFCDIKHNSYDSKSSKHLYFLECLTPEFEEISGYTSNDLEIQGAKLSTSFKLETEGETSAISFSTNSGGVFVNLLETDKPTLVTLSNAAYVFPRYYQERKLNPNFKITGFSHLKSMNIILDKLYEAVNSNILIKNIKDKNQEYKISDISVDATLAYFTSLDNKLFTDKKLKYNVAVTQFTLQDDFEYLGQYIFKESYLDYSGLSSFMSNDKPIFPILNEIDIFSINYDKLIIFIPYFSSEFSLDRVENYSDRPTYYSELDFGDMGTLPLKIKLLKSGDISATLTKPLGEETEATTRLIKN